MGNAVPETGHEQTVLERLCSYTLNPLGRLQSGAHLAFAPHILLSQKAGPPVAASQARRPLFYCLVASPSPSLSPSPRVTPIGEELGVSNLVATQGLKCAQLHLQPLPVDGMDHDKEQWQDDER